MKWEEKSIIFSAIISKSGAFRIIESLRGPNHRTLGIMPLLKCSTLIAFVSVSVSIVSVSDIF